MNYVLWVLITLAAAVGGGLLLNKIKFPAGALVGALVAVGILNIFTGKMCMPSQVKIIAKAISGLFIGMSVTMDTVRGLKKLFKPAIILVVIILSLCLVMGVVLSRLSSLDSVTALFSVAPGGMMDMTLMSMDLGGDSSVVAVLQVIRLLSVYCISMPLARFLSKRLSDDDSCQLENHFGMPSKKEALSDDEKKKRIIFSVIVATSGGIIGYFLSELADFGTLLLITCMVISAFVNIRTGKLYMPRWVRRIAQILSGSLIGLNMTYESLIRIKSALIPALIICCGFVIINVLLAFVIHKTCGIRMSTAMLASSAGGASESALVAQDFGASPAIVSVLQVTRLVCTTAFYPVIVKFILL